MQLLIAPAKPAAQALNAKALAFIRAEQNATAEAWSPVYSDGSQFGILYDGTIRKALTDSELGAVVNGEGIETLANVVEVEWEVAP